MNISAKEKRYKKKLQSIKDFIEKHPDQTEIYALRNQEQDFCGRLYFFTPLGVLRCENQFANIEPKKISSMVVKFDKKWEKIDFWELVKNFGKPRLESRAGR